MTLLLGIFPYFCTKTFSISPQVLKKDLYFDPEFWNLIALRTNCLKLMSEKVVSAALEEIMEDKWILNYCTKEPAFRSGTSACRKGSKVAAKKRHQKEDRYRKEDTDTASKRLKVGPGKTGLNVDHTVKKKGNQGSQPLKDGSSKPLRRSFWQLDRLQDNVSVGCGELRRTTRLSEKNPPKRRIRTPKWLLEDSGTLEENNVHLKIKKHGLKHEKHHRSSVVNRSETGQIKNNAKHKPSVNSHLMARENNSKHQKGFSLDCLKPAPPPQVILELSLPDNELMGTFIEDTCNRQRGFPQVLLYKPTVKLPAAPQPVKTVHRKEVVLRARDATMFVKQLHCYTRRQKGKGSGSNIQGSVSTITRSSVQGSPPKDPPRELCEKPAAEMKGGVASRTPAAANVTESPVLEKVLQAQSTGKVSQTLTSTRELCEESAVEMKVTIASQTPTKAKVTQSPGLDKVSKSQTVKDASKTTTSAEQTSTVDKNRIVVSDEIPAVIGAADPMPSQSQDVLKDGKQKLKSISSQAETGKNPVAQAKTDTPEVLTTVSISEVDVSEVSPKGHVPCENDTSPAGTMVTVRKMSKAEATPTDEDSINDISALTLVTEMVTELAPGALARDLENHKQPAPEDGASRESRAGSKPKVPHRLRTTSSCSVPELGASVTADVQGKKEGTQDIAPETPENSDSVESEESKLEYCCTFCNKIFKGSRVVAHAMFHYRKDECMFCGTMFKDDLLAMMHLSDHIEKLKRSKESAGNNAQENGVSETKDISTPKTSAKVKSTNVSSGRRSSGRQRKFDVCPKSISLPDSTPSGSRQLRSNDKPVEGPSLQEKKQNASKLLNSKTPVHMVNGHIGKKKDLDRPKRDTINSEAKQPHAQQEISEERTSDGAENPRLQENQDIEMDSSATSAEVDQEFGCSTADKVLKTATKQDGKVVEEKNVEPQEKVCCPVDGCAWFTDLSKNRVALLYHALEDHYGEVEPLELAFNVGNSRCSICMRVMWSFKHFQHHVERHRLSPRHPCLHQGCTSRFKTGMEMRRHARRHSPLQAVCCLPGCSQLFICLWALNLHEREHYASKPTKSDKNTNEQTGDKHNNTPAGKKQSDHKPKDETATTTLNKTVSVKAARKLRGQTTHNSSTGKHVKAPPSLLKEELKESSETKDSHVLKNLSNKDTSAQPTGPNLRLRQTIRKVKGTNTSLTASKTHKVISSSLLKHNIKVRHKFKKKQVKVNTKGPKRRGRPPKKAVHDENTTTGQSNETVKETALQKDQKSPAQLASPPKATETSNVSSELKEEKSQQVQDAVKTTETSIDESESKKSLNKQIKKNHVKQKGISHNTSTATVTANSSNQSITTTSADKTHKLNADKMKNKAKKRSAPKENGSQTASSDPSKSKRQKVTNSKANTENVKKKSLLKEPVSASKTPAKSKSVVPQVEAKAAAIESSADEEGKAKAENTDSTQNGSGDSVPVAPANSLNEMTAPPTTSGEKTQKVTTEGKSKKSHIAKKEGKKEKSTHTASSDSGKTNKKHKDTTNKKGDKERRPCKDVSKTSALKKTAKSKSGDQQVEAKAAGERSPDVEGKAKEETSDTAGSSIPAATASGLNETTSPPAEENTQKVTKKEKSKKSHVTKNADPNKAKKKLKDVQKEGDTKIVKKKCEDQGGPSVSEKSKTPAETPQSTTGSPGYSVIMNGQATSEKVKSMVFKDTLAKYSKRPYMRLPPTAYLDEKYITMPKRRKEMSFFQSSQKSPPPEQAQVATALQRQRCANCFATFNSAEELQSHLQLQKCSNLFGFDSDDEGKSACLDIESAALAQIQDNPDFWK